MTFHFAYPNVLPRQKKFIGCGRYTLCRPGELPGSGYEEVQGVPNTPNKITLNRVAQLLAPRSYDSAHIMFHRQDQVEVPYQGDSLDLAWFLAHVFRSNRLRCGTESDIWCTGVIQLDSSGPYLLDVEQNGFMLKLEAFLASSNPDRYFIVPLPNMTPGARRMCDEGGAEVRRIGALCGKKGVPAGEEKLILTVASDELPLLLDALFVRSERMPGSVHRLVVLLVLLAAAGAGYMLWRSASTTLVPVSHAPAPAQQNSLPAPQSNPSLSDTVQPEEQPQAPQVAPVVEADMQQAPQQSLQQTVSSSPESAPTTVPELPVFPGSLIPEHKTEQDGEVDASILRDHEHLDIPIDPEAVRPLPVRAQQDEEMESGAVQQEGDDREQADVRPGQPFGGRNADFSDEESGVLLEGPPSRRQPTRVRSTGLGRKLSDDEW